MLNMSKVNDSAPPGGSSGTIPNLLGFPSGQDIENKKKQIWIALPVTWSSDTNSWSQFSTPIITILDRGIVILDAYFALFFIDDGGWRGS